MSLISGHKSIGIDRIETPAFNIGAVKDVPGFGTLYSAWRRGEPDKWFEFLDCIDPPTPRSRKWIVMVSSQFGCAIGCRFCDAGYFGYRGNLSVEEILGQVRFVLSAHPEIEAATVPKLKVHVARMGEPTLNEAVLQVLESLGRSGDLPGLLPSISTMAPRCDLSRRFLDDLAKIKDTHFGEGRFQLQFSLHSTDEEARHALIPVRKWDLEEIAAFGERWFKPGDRLVTLNVALSDDIPFAPEVAARIFSPERFLFKFTAVHNTRRGNMNALTKLWCDAPERIAQLAADLERRGFRTIVDPGWPEEARAGLSCGQLALSVTEEGARAAEVGLGGVR